MDRETEELIEIGTLAERLGVSTVTVRRLERDGLVPQAMRLATSGRRVWRRSDLDQLPTGTRTNKRQLVEHAGSAAG